MPSYPVMFTLRDAVSGNGFLAGITVSGRALMTMEDDGKWWVYGVRPGALAACSEIPQEAYRQFRETYTKVLFDFAEEAKEFSAFKLLVEKFYSEPDLEEESRWMEAFEAIRAGKVSIESPFTELPKETPENRPTFVTVLQLNVTQRYTSADNIPDKFEFAAAA